MTTTASRSHRFSSVVFEPDNVNAEAEVVRTRHDPPTAVLARRAVRAKDRCAIASHARPYEALRARSTRARCGPDASRPAQRVIETIGAGRDYVGRGLRSRRSEIYDRGDEPAQREDLLGLPIERVTTNGNGQDATGRDLRSETCAWLAGQIVRPGDVMLDEALLGLFPGNATNNVRELGQVSINASGTSLTVQTSDASSGVVPATAFACLLFTPASQIAHRLQAQQCATAGGVWFPMAGSSTTIDLTAYPQFLNAQFTVQVAANQDANNANGDAFYNNITADTTTTGGTFPS